MNLQVRTDPVVAAIKAFKLAAGIPAQENMRHVGDVFGMYYTCLWRSPSGAEMVQGNVFLGEDGASTVCICLRLPLRVAPPDFEILPWYRVSSLDTDTPVVEKIDGFKYAIG